MGNNSVSSREERPPPTASSVVPSMPPPSAAQEHIGGKSSKMESVRTNKPPVTTDVNKSDAQPCYGRMISYRAMTIRRGMETWAPFSRPRHFAQRRTDFSNSTPWFRGVQTGFWSTNDGDARNGKDANGQEEKYCTGLYIAGCPPVGRYVDSEVIITSINGPDNRDKHIVDRQRQAGNSLKERIPVGVAVSKDACKPDANGVKTFPCPLPEGLDCVALTWFLITHMWPKPGLTANGETKTVWMVRLEKIDLSERSWWSNGAHGSLPYPSLEERDFKTKAAKEACQTCGQTSVRLFKRHFVCLNEGCAEWFRVDGELVETEPTNLVYNDNFLGERFDRTDDALAPQPLEESYPNLYPTFEQFIAKNYPDPQGSESSITAQNLAERNKALLTGFSCPQCGLLNSRVQYHGWYCRNTDCRDAEGKVNPFSYHAPPAMLTPELLEAERQQQTKTTKADKPLSALLGYQGTRDLESHVAYELDFGAGCRATIFRPKPGSAAAAKADELFKKVQEDAASGALGLARRSVSANGGLNLTNHFVENYGERYNLPFALSDIPLNEAPAVVSAALAAANGYMREYFGHDNDECEFNEIYIAAYLTNKMGMSFHDDGETGLGSVIGTYTLGGRATFKFCIKPQFDYGRPKENGTWMKPQGGQVDPIPAGCTEEGFRTELRAAFKRGEISEAEWTSQLQDHMDAHMAGPGRKYVKRTVASFTVQHGDVVIMWGANTQRYMEHGVECRSPMRFAVTLRRVTKDMGTPEQWARLDARLESDRAFTPPWAQAEGRKRKAEEGEGKVGKVKVKDQAAGAKKSKAK